MKSKLKPCLCPTCKQNLNESPHNGLNGKDCPQCGQGLRWRYAEKSNRQFVAETYPWPSLLPALRRWGEICVNRGSRHLLGGNLIGLCIENGKLVAIKQIITHLEREARNGKT